MATNFPASLDALTNPTSSDSLSSPSHSAQHANVNDAVEALQAKVGADSSAVTSSLDYKIAQLEARGRLVAVKHASLTAAQSASVAPGGNVAVTSLSITHTLADAANKLIIHAHLGMVGTSNTYGMVGLAVANDGTLIEVGDAAGVRTQVGSFNRTGSGTTSVVQQPSLTFVYAPGDTSSHTYTVRAINVDTLTRTLYINQSENAANLAAFARGASAFVIQEVSA